MQRNKIKISILTMKHDLRQSSSSK